MKAPEIKLKLLHYFRFKRRYLFIATEVGVLNSDVLVSNEKTIIEFEVKTSKQDFNNEFKKRKHTLMQKKEYANYFYFAIPEKLKEYVLEKCAETKYGVVVISEEKLTRDGCFVEIVKKADKLHASFNDKLFKSIVQRMGSELIREKIKYENAIQRLTNKKVQQTAKRTSTKGAK